MEKKTLQKLTKGQMVYAPISSIQRVSKSPFTEKKVALGNQMIRQSNFNIRKFDNEPYTKQLSMSSSHEQTVLRANSDKQIEEYIEILLRQNSSLKEKQEIYISKHMKLEEGLEKQHKQFMNLQDLYTELFNSYKQKQEQIANLQLRYKQTERERTHYNSMKKDAINLALNTEKNNSFKSSIEDNFKNQLTQLILQNKRLNQTNQKLISELNYSKSKEKLNESKQILQQKVFDDIQSWQKQIDSEKQQRIKLQYQIKFLRIRIQDIQKNTNDLEKIISLKQNQIIRMREQKMNMRRQSSQKVLNRSSSKSGMDSARSKNGQNRKLAQIVESLQKQNNRLREENMALKQRIRQILIKQYNTDNFHHNREPLSITRKLEYEDKYSNDNYIERKHNENFSSQNTNKQYFSFSRERQEKYSQNSDLPTFPMDLQIQGIIEKHKGNIKQRLQNRILEQI